MKEYLREVIDMQSGRVRYDFAERLDKSRLEFRWEMLQRIEQTIEGIEAAIKKGIGQRKRKRGEKEVEERKRVIMEMMQRLNDIGKRLMHIKEQLEK